MSSESPKLRREVSFGGLLGLLFIGLKLTDFIDWSWWWVLSPFWVPLAFAGLVLLVLLVLLVIGIITSIK